MLSALELYIKILCLMCCHFYGVLIHYCFYPYFNGKFKHYIFPYHQLLHNHETYSSMNNKSELKCLSMHGTSFDFVGTTSKTPCYMES